MKKERRIIMANTELLNRNLNNWNKARKTIDNNIGVYEQAEAVYKAICTELQSAHPDKEKVLHLCMQLEQKNNSSDLNLSTAIENFIRITRWACQNDFSQFVLQAFVSPVTEIAADESQAAVKTQVITWKRTFKILNKEIGTYANEATIYYNLLAALRKTPLNITTILNLNDQLQESCQDYRSVNQKLVTNVNGFTGMVKTVGKDKPTMLAFLNGLKNDGLLQEIDAILNQRGDVDKVPSLDITVLSFINQQDGVFSEVNDPLYDNTHYLTPVIMYDSLVKTPRKVVLHVKLFNTQNELMQGNNSPAGFTFKDELDNPGEFSKDQMTMLSGWGGTTGNSYTAGNYICEIWESDTLLIRQSVTILPAKKDKPFTITKVEFANTTYNGDIVNDFNTSIHNNTEYLKAKFYYEVSDLKTPVKLRVKLFNPSNVLCRGNDSPPDCTWTEEYTPSYEDGVYTCSGWGNKNRNCYNQIGRWTIEFWHNGKLLNRTYVDIKKYTAPPPPPRPPKPPKPPKPAWKKWRDRIIWTAILIIGGWYGYTKWYIPYKIDADAPRYYVYADNLFLRTSPDATGDGNKITKLTYGTELITYSYDPDGWADVKSKEDKEKGYVSSRFIMNENDFSRLSLAMSYYVKEDINIARNRAAIVDFMKKMNMNYEWRVNVSVPGKYPNRILYPSLANGYTKYPDFAFIMRNENTTEEQLAIYSFEDDETPVLVHQEKPSQKGENIKSITYSKNAQNKYRVTYVKDAPFEITKIELANVNNEGRILTKYGGFLPKNSSFIKPKLNYTLTNQNSMDVTFQVKMFRPSGELMRGNKSPANYTYTHKATVNKNRQSVELIGWGSKERTTYSPGVYTIEIYVRNELKFRKEFTIHDW